MNERQVHDDYGRLCRRAFAGGLPPKSEPHPRWRVNWFVIALCVATLAWFVYLALMLREKS